MMQNREFVFGWDPKSSKRSSGLFSVLKWFGNKESVSAPAPDLVHSNSSSCESIESVFSTDTVASFAFVPPNSYKPFGTALQPEKYFLSGPETSTYRARLAQREARRETDRNLTLRSKYNLYKGPEPDRGHSLPLMTKTSVEEKPGMHRRTASESSKHRRAGAYCHVKGKRRAPQPPGLKGESTLRRRKRLAPQPPTSPDVISNDSLKLDHGILKPAKDQETTTSKIEKLQEIMQVSPRPWYKRTLSKSSVPEKKSDCDKRKSGLSFLTNISELDREAMEIVSKENLKMKYLKNVSQAPAFMRPKGNEHTRTNSDSWLSPKRKSAKDLIAKFNAITGVSRVSINSASREIVKEQSPQIKESTPEIKEPKNNARNSFQIEKKETKTTAVVKPISRSQWNCPKCTVENDYWRIICRVCSTIKPYFDDFTSISTASSPLTETKTAKQEQKIDKKDDLFGLANTEFRISELQRTVFQSQYPKLSLDFDFKIDGEKNASEITQKDFIKPQSKINDNSNLTNNVLKSTEISNFFQVQYPKINKDLKKSSLQTEKVKLDEKQQTEIEKMILGDELMFQKPETSEPNPKAKTKVEKIILGDELSVEKPDYINVNKYEKIEVDKHEPEKIKLTKTTRTDLENPLNNNETNLKIVANEDEKKNSAKKEEREKLKRMLIEMKNSLPKRVTKNQNESKHRVSLIQEQNEPEVEEPTSPQEQEEKTAEIIVATTETVYENIKVKHDNMDKPLKVSSSAQTSSVLKRNLPNSETGFHLIGAKDFVGISNEQTNSNHTYANVREAVPADTLEINRLLRRLEAAIAAGQLGQAAVLARDLAELKLPLSVVRHKNSVEDSATGSNTIQTLNVDMYVEDKISHRGPFPLQVTETMTVAELKTLVDEKYKIPKGVQRWILGKQLAADDNATLASHQITTSGCPVFLYLVAPADDFNGNIRFDHGVLNYKVSERSADSYWAELTNKWDASKLYR